MDYVIAFFMYSLAIYVAIKFTSSQWYIENKEKELNKKQLSLVMAWFLIFLSSQLYIIKGVVDYIWSN